MLHKEIQTGLEQYEGKYFWHNLFLGVNYPFKARRRQTSEKQQRLKERWSKRDGERLKTEKDWIKGERGNNRQPQESIKPPPRRKHRTSRNDWNRIASASTPQQTKAPIVQCCATNTARGNIGALKKHGVTPLPSPPLLFTPAFGCLLSLNCDTDKAMQHHCAPAHCRGSKLKNMPFVSL